MNSKASPSPRADFQLERLVLFSDAVFAIAITLLVIEIKVPALHGPEATDRNLLFALARMTPRFIGFFISFFLIGMYWTRHHALFGKVVASTAKLMWLNLVFLLSIVLMPFTTGFFGEYSAPSTIQLRLPLIVYVLNICFSGFTLFLLWRYVGDPASGVLDPAADPVETRDARNRALLVPAVFAASIPVAFIDGYLARYVPLLVPLVLRLVVRRRRSHRPAPAGGGN